MALPAQVLIRYDWDDWTPPDDYEALCFRDFEVKAGPEPWRKAADEDPLQEVRASLKQLGYRCRRDATYVGTRGSWSNPTKHLETWVSHRPRTQPKPEPRPPGGEAHASADATTSATADYSEGLMGEQLRLMAGF